MYAIIATGGKQYKVAEGEKVRVEKLEGEIGGKITLDRVLMLGEGTNVKIGRPTVEGASVEAEITDQARHKKIVVFKYKRRKNYRRKYGHRQPYTELKINRIAG